jgi:hypothetical protein
MNKSVYSTVIIVLFCVFGITGNAAIRNPLNACILRTQDPKKSVANRAMTVTLSTAPQKESSFSTPLERTGKRRANSAPELGEYLGHATHKGTHQLCRVYLASRGGYYIIDAKTEKLLNTIGAGNDHQLNTLVEFADVKSEAPAIDTPRTDEKNEELDFFGFEKDDNDAQPSANNSKNGPVDDSLPDEMEELSLDGKTPSADASPKSKTSSGSIDSTTSLQERNAALIRDLLGDNIS